METKRLVVFAALASVLSGAGVAAPGNGKDVLADELAIVTRMFADDPEISVTSVGGKVLLSGSTANADALKRVSQAVAMDSGTIMSQVAYSAAALQVLVNDFLQRSGVQGVTAGVVGREVCLSGKMYDNGQIAALTKRLTSFLADFPGVTVNNDGLRVLKQKIVIGIEFLNYDVSRAKSLGIALPDSVSAKGTLTYTVHDNLTGSFASDNLSATLNLLKENQVAKKLYSTTLSTQSGEEAEFQSGGTLYKQTADLYKTALTEIEYGYIIKAKPTIVDANTVNLDFDLDLRTPVASTSGNGDTDVTRYQTRSKYIVRPGESILLSGFNHMKEDQTRRGLPWFSRLPLIGSWFGNDAGNKTTTEMLLAVTINWALEDDTEAVHAKTEKLRAKPVEIDMP